DVGKLTTTGVQEGDHWRLSGEKWFCSNADAEVVMLLARPQGAEAGTRGVGLFLMPRHLEDGSQNHYRIVRLKDKLGTRSMASGEIKFDGAIAYAVGSIERGFLQMAEMVNWSRLSNGVKSTALMRRALQDALTVARGRGGIGYVEEFASARLLRDAHLGSIWEGTGNIIALDAISRAIGRHHAEGALAADLHARLQETPSLPHAYRDRLKGFVDRAISFA